MKKYEIKMVSKIKKKQKHKIYKSDIFRFYTSFVNFFEIPSSPIIFGRRLEIPWKHNHDINTKIKRIRKTESLFCYEVNESKIACPPSIISYAL